MTPSTQNSLVTIEFLKNIIDCSDEHIAVINTHGDVVFTNAKWNKFAAENGSNPDTDWRKFNYFDVCKKAIDSSDDAGKEALDSITTALRAKMKINYFDYPCHSRTKKRWFSLTSNPIKIDDNEYMVIMHKDISKLKMAENIIARQLKADPLTSLANRRYLEEFIKKQLTYCRIQNLTVSLLILNINNLDIVNRNQGVEKGDLVVKNIAQSLMPFARKSTDLCGRLSGQQMCILWCNISTEEALTRAEDINITIHKLKSLERRDPIPEYISVSIGLTTPTISENISTKKLIDDTIDLMQMAKLKGSNQIVCSE